MMAPLDVRYPHSSSLHASPQQNGRARVRQGGQSAKHIVHEGRLLHHGGHSDLRRVHDPLPTLAPPRTKKWRQVRRLAKVVELEFGFCVQIGHKQQFAAHHTGGEERVGLRQYD